MQLETKVLSLLGVNPKAGTFGVEVEVEAEDHLPDEVHGWRPVRDGSLRGNSLEYVFNRPVSITTARTRLAVLQKKLEGSRVINSVRAGVHIHFNMSEKTWKELITFLTVYYTLEEILLEYCGEGRKGNFFCLRAKDAEFVVDALFEVVSTGNIGHLDTENLRYAALNLYALFNKGSIEFRAIKTPLNLVNGVLPFLEFFEETFKKVNENYLNPVDVVTALSAGGVDEYIDSVTTPFWAERIKASPYYENKIMNGARLIQHFVFADSWNK